MNKAFFFLFFAILSVAAHAEIKTLDFSSGIYNFSNTSYSEDGFNVSASSGFDPVKLGTLAWYEGNDLITVSSGGNLFNLDQMTIVDTTYTGLTFESSRGGILSVGTISGLLKFNGDAWDSIQYFTIKKTSSVDILSEIDNMVLTTVSPVPEPSQMLLTLSGLGVLLLARRTGK